jgi:hypothetical protein
MKALSSFKHAALFGCVLCTLPLAAQAPLNLYNGTSMFGWDAHGTWSSTGGVLATTGNDRRHILTAMPFGDFSLQFEYNQTGSATTKLRLWATREDAGGVTIDLDSSNPRVQIGGVEGASPSPITGTFVGWHKVQVNASGGHLSVLVDGIQAGSAANLGSRAGYIGFEAAGAGSLQLRNIKLTPANLPSIFNGRDLSGWKAVAHRPASSGGVGHAMEKTLTFGIAGGSAKSHAAKWTVNAGAIHGEDGPGGLEYGSVDDAILQLSAKTKGSIKSENFVALSLRDPSGQLNGGYEAGIGPYAGAINSIAKHATSAVTTFVDETIVIAGRTLAVWVNGNLTTLYTDPRPEAATTAQGAKTTAGTVALILPNNGEQVDVQRLALAGLVKTYGAALHAPAAPAPTTQTVAAVAPITAPTPVEAALIQQQQASAKESSDDKATKQRTAALMSQALTTTDPQQQMSLYGQVVQLDPSNAAAVQGFKEAQARVQATQAAEQQTELAQVNQQQDSQTREQQTTKSLATAQSAFLNGHLGQANTALAVAERLSPDNPMVRDLRSRISAASSLRSRLYFLGGGAGLLGIAGLFALWMRRRGLHRYPVLELTKGLDEGRNYSMDKDVIRIGAVSQDGGQKNDIVVRDVEHAISRFHCEVIKKDGQLYITDLKSSNGTKLDGTPLVPGQAALLRKGDRILLANSVEMRFGYTRRRKTETGS